jgi:hypothetical protein
MFPDKLNLVQTLYTYKQCLFRGLWFEKRMESVFRGGFGEEMAHLGLFLVFLKKRAKISYQLQNNLASFR